MSIKVVWDFFSSREKRFIILLRCLLMENNFVDIGKTYYSAFGKDQGVLCNYYMKFNVCYMNRNRCVSLVLFVIDISVQLMLGVCHTGVLLHFCVKQDPGTARQGTREKSV